MSARGNSTVIRRKVFEYFRYMTDNGWRMRCQCGCDVEFNPASEKWEAHHDDKPHTYGGSDDPPNTKPLLYRCHRDFSAKQKTFMAKGQRQSDRIYGVRRTSQPMPGGKDSPWKKTFGRGWVRRDEE